MTNGIGHGASGGAAGTLLAGKYQLDARLGVGGMAEVFRGHTIGAEGFRKPIAIKRVLVTVSQNPSFAEMFISEARLSSKLQHPNIVSVLDFDRDAEGCPYLVMELVEGRDLDGLIDSGRLPFSVIIYVISEVLRGLGYAHDLPVGADGVRGLIHRDVSPHNVLLSWNGAVKVSDFGIAKARAATAASASVSIKGKPAYMSPEQIQGAPLDGRSDLFAVGVMLWQMLTGQYLFAAGGTAETLARVLYGNIPPVRSIAGDVPPDLEAVTMKLLARHVDHRYATAEQAIDALLHCTHAPRDGRRELEQLLAARFPGKAPVRTGQRSRQEVAPPAHVAVGTPAGAATTPMPWSPEQLAVMSAETRTFQPAGVPAPSAPARRPSWKPVALVGAALAVAVAIGAAVMSGREAPPSDSGAGEAVHADASAAVSATDVDAAAVVAAAVDAAMPVPAEPPVDAAVPVDAGSPDARRRRPDAPQDKPGSGRGSTTIHDIPISE